jgi:hypothetical protein
LAGVVLRLGHRPIGQRNHRSPTEFGHKLSLAEDQRGLVADTSLGRQRKPA